MHFRVLDIEDEASVAFSLKITKERSERAKSGPAFSKEGLLSARNAIPFPTICSMYSAVANVHSHHSMWREWKNSRGKVTPSCLQIEFQLEGRRVQQRRNELLVVEEVGQDR